ncbi:hypothetical protein CR513_54687, partial [Mucuna pruriens]
MYESLAHISPTYLYPVSNTSAYAEEKGRKDSLIQQHEVGTETCPLSKKFLLLGNSGQEHLVSSGLQVIAKSCLKLIPQRSQTNNQPDPNAANAPSTREHPFVDGIMEAPMPKG